MSRTCFIIQPFDGGRFDKLYEDTFTPALLAADLSPYRVDRDPQSAIPIEDIEDRIRKSDVCFADISTDNPNVWFELGYAIASRRALVMACHEDRTTFPFDVQHRYIIRYKSESPRDFDDLRERITVRAKAALEREEKQLMVRSAELTEPVSGLGSHEVACLATLVAQAEGISGSVSHYETRTQMERAGYTPLATKVALRRLISAGFVNMVMEQEWNSSDTYEAYTVTDSGWNWITNNQGKLSLRVAPSGGPASTLDDDIPF